MQPSSRRRLVSGAAALMLMGATLVSTAGSALAGQTRTITIGSPDGHGNVSNGVLTFTAATSGGATRTDVTVINSSGHTLSDAHLLINLDHSALPTDVKIVAVFNGDAGLCPPFIDPVASLNCSFDNMAAKDVTSTRSLSLVFSVGNPGAHTIQVELKVAETGSDVGSNQNYAIAQSTINVWSPTCQNVQTFVPPRQAKNLDLPTGLTGCNPDQRSGLVIPAQADGSLVPH